MMRRLSNDMANAKNDMADLTDLITNVLNALAGAGKMQSRRSNNAALGAITIEKTLGDVIARQRLRRSGLRLASASPAPPASWT
jgi:hypothetical protein